MNTPEGTKTPAEREVDAIFAAYEGVMLTYTEQDFPTSEPYPRTIPGWKCRRCGQEWGTSGYPPSVCVCDAQWRKADPSR